MNQLIKQFDWIFENLKLNFKAMLAYKTAFVIQVIGMVFNNSAFLIVWGLFFYIFKDVNGWTFKEIFGLEGFITIAFGVVHAFIGGTRNISNYCTEGKLDKFLVLPKNLVLNIALSDSAVSALGDLVYGILLLGIFFVINSLTLTDIILIIVLAILTIVVFTSFSLLTQSIVFWLPNSSNVSHALFEFMLGPAMYPSSTFTGKIRLFFTFVVPALLIGGIPVDMVKTHSIHLLILLVFLSCFWLIFAIFVFYKGIKKYESGNLM